MKCFGLLARASRLSACTATSQKAKMPRHTTASRVWWIWHQCCSQLVVRGEDDVAFSCRWASPPVAYPASGGCLKALNNGQMVNALAVPGTSPLGNILQDDWQFPSPAQWLFDATKKTNALRMGDWEWVRARNSTAQGVRTQIGQKWGVLPGPSKSTSSS